MSWLRPVKVCEPLVINGFYGYHCCVTVLNSALVSSTPVEPVTDQLSPAGIAAVIMGLGLLILAAVCITLVVYVVWNRIYHRKKHISTYNYLFCMFILSQCCTCQFLQESAQGEGTRGVVYQLTE